MGEIKKKGIVPLGSEQPACPCSWGKLLAPGPRSPVASGQGSYDAEPKRSAVTSEETEKS